MANVITSPNTNFLLSSFSYPQTPRPVPPKTSSVVTAGVCRPAWCATATMTVGTPAMRRSAQLPPVGSTNSAAMTQSASLPCGAVTATRTVRTSQTNPWSAAAGGQNHKSLAAQLGSFSVEAESVST